METIKLKKATEADAGDIMSVVRKSFKEYAQIIHQEGNIAALHETEEDIKNDIRKKNVYICQLDGVTIGSVRIELLREGIAYLSRLGVDPEYQSLGIGGLLVSPLHAPLPDSEPEASPYFASSRCWRNPLHLRVEQVAGYDPADRELAAIAADGRSLGDDRHIDRPAVWLLKRAALRRIWELARPAGRERSARRQAHAASEGAASRTARTAPATLSAATTSRRPWRHRTYPTGGKGP